MEWILLQIELRKLNSLALKDWFTPVIVNFVALTRFRCQKLRHSSTIKARTGIELRFRLCVLKCAEAVEFCQFNKSDVSFNCMLFKLHSVSVVKLGKFHLKILKRAIPRILQVRVLFRLQQLERWLGPPKANFYFLELPYDLGYMASSISVVRSVTSHFCSENHKVVHNAFKY